MNRLLVLANRVRVLAKQKVHTLVTWVRFGTITSEVKGYAGGGVVCEIEYRGRRGQVVGYWAYGHFDPTGPYQG